MLNQREEMRLPDLRKGVSQDSGLSWFREIPNVQFCIWIDTQLLQAYLLVHTWNDEASMSLLHVIVVSIILVISIRTDPARGMMQPFWRRDSGKYRHFGPIGSSRKKLRWRSTC